MWKMVTAKISNDENIENELPLNEETDAVKFKEYLEELKEFAKKVSEDKAELQKLATEPEGFPFNDVSAVSLEEQYKSLQKELEVVLEECRGAAEAHLEQPRQAVDRFQAEYARFSEDMERVLKKLQAKTRRKGKRRLAAEAAIGTTEEGTGEEHQLLKELCKSDQVKSVLKAIRTCINKITVESRWNWKKTVLDISEFLGQNYQDIRNQLETSIQQAKTNIGDQTQVSEVQHQTDDIEKQMLDIFTTVERQALDFHAVHDTLQFFNRKFVHFSEKCHSKWDAHCTRHDGACAHLREAQGELERGAARLAEASARLAAQAPEVVALMGRLRSAGDADGVATTVRELRDAVRATEAAVTSRLEELAEALRRQGERLCPVLQAVEDLGLLDDLLRTAKGPPEASSVCLQSEVSVGQWGEIISIVDTAITKTKYSGMQERLPAPRLGEKQLQDSDVCESGSEINVNEYTESEFTFGDSEPCLQSEC